jgi:hypothetical protein
MAPGRPRQELRTLADLVDQARAGLIRIPPFQRQFVWSAHEVVALFDSISRGFPIGGLVLWPSSAPAARVRIGPIAVDAPEQEVAHWVLDGHQRMAAIVGGLAPTADVDPRFRVHLDVETGAFAVLTTAPAPVTWMPAGLLFDDRARVRWWEGRAQELGYADGVRVERITEAFREYRIPTTIIPSTVDDVVSVFVRLNSAGERLTDRDLVAARRPGIGDEPSDVDAFARVPAAQGWGVRDDGTARLCAEGSGDETRARSPALADHFERRMRELPICSGV